MPFERKRSVVLQAMTEAGITKFMAPDFSASLRQGSPTLAIAAEDLIPAAWKPQPAKLDKLTLLAALKSGGAIAEVSLRRSAHAIERQEQVTWAFLTNNAPH